VILQCASCVGPVTKGITLVYPISALLQPFTGAPTRISLSLLETAGWLKDPQNTLKAWTAPTKCDMIQVLSRLSSVSILGDWTTWYESVAIDTVQFMNLKSKFYSCYCVFIYLFNVCGCVVGQLPLCSMTMPDASICPSTCT
jgi:hypothetical protein